MFEKKYILQYKKNQKRAKYLTLKNCIKKKDQKSIDWSDSTRLPFHAFKVVHSSKGPTQKESLKDKPKGKNIVQHA